jgi:metal-responsive CopG/Arc/MetJ family transcriptional regulator
MKYYYTSFMKTAISVPDDIFKELEEFSKEHDYSRSEVFAMAVKEFLEKRKSKELLNALNEAYSESESPEEITVRERGKRYFAKKILKEQR